MDIPPQDLPPMGWYPDPAGSSDERYWDGQQWTRNVRKPEVTSSPVVQTAGADHLIVVTNPSESSVDPGGPLDNPQVPDPATIERIRSKVMADALKGDQERPSAQTQIPDRGPHQGHSLPPQSGAGRYPSSQMYFGSPVSYFEGPVTSAGMKLAGWWWRVLSTIVDYFIVNLIASLAGFVFVQRLLEGYTKYFQDVMDLSRSGGSISQIPDPNNYDIAQPALWLSLVTYAVGLLYTILLLRFKSATVGQLMCGLRVVDESSGKVAPLGWGQASLRAVTYYVIVLAGNYLLYIPLLINFLMPLFDPKRQTLHDKAAKTQVVKL